MSKESLLRLRLLVCIQQTETLPAAEQMTLVTLLMTNVIKDAVPATYQIQASELIAQAVVAQLKELPIKPLDDEQHFDMYFAALQDAARHSPNMLKHIDDSKVYIKDAYYAGVWQGALNTGRDK